MMKLSLRLLRFHPALALYLSAAVLMTFLSAATDTVRALEQAQGAPVSTVTTGDISATEISEAVNAIAASSEDRQYVPAKVVFASIGFLPRIKPADLARRSIEKGQTEEAARILFNTAAAPVKNLI